MKKTITIIGLIALITVTIIIAFNLEKLRWNNGTCLFCHTNYVYDGYHFEGKNHDKKMYDYSCDCSYTLPFTLKWDSVK